MGMWKPFRSHCRDDSHEHSVYPSYTEERAPKRTTPPASGNPNPTNFRIKRSEKIGRFVILLINYPDCHNYEGDKILVFENISVAALKRLTSLDPHFCDDSGHPSPIARFEPTSNGWSNATKFCKIA